MAHYRHWPVWKATLDLAVHLEHTVRRFPRSQRHTVGLRALRPGLGPRSTEWTLAGLPLLRQQLHATGTGHQVVGQTGDFKTCFKQRALTAQPLPFKSNLQPLRA